MNNVPHFSTQIRNGDFFILLRYSPYGFCDVAHKGTEGVGIGSKADGMTYGIFKTISNRLPVMSPIIAPNIGMDLRNNVSMDLRRLAGTWRGGGGFGGVALTVWSWPHLKGEGTATSDVGIIYRAPSH